MAKSHATRDACMPNALRTFKDGAAINNYLFPQRVWNDLEIQNYGWAEVSKLAVIELVEL